MYQKFEERKPYELLNTSKYPPEVAGRFNSFITTQFDDSLSVEMQMRSIIKWAIDNFKEMDKTYSEFVEFLNDLIEYMNNFIETFDEKYQETILDKIQEWYDNGELETLINESLDTKYHEMDNRLNTQLTQIMRESAVNFGVQGEGDDTQAIQLAAQSGKEVHFNSGVYEISDTIFFSENTHFIATGKTVFKITSDVDVFKLKRNNQLVGFDYDFTSVKPYTKDVFEISSRLLEDVDFTLGHRYNLQIKIQRSNFYFSNGRFDEPTGTIFHIWASKQDQFNQKWKVVGFWGIDIDETYVTGWIGFVMRDWAYRIDQTSNTGWLTGVRINKLTVNSAHWGLFGSYSLSTMDDLRYTDIGNLYVTNFLFQNQDSKYMAFFTTGYKFITDAIPWDWDYYTETAPFLIQYRPNGYMGKFLFNHGYGGLLDQMEVNNKPADMTKDDELNFLYSVTGQYIDVHKNISGNNDPKPFVWHELELLSGWEGKLEYHKDINSVVHIRGTINSGTVDRNTHIGTLPTGYTPSVLITEIASTVDSQFSNPRIQPLTISTYGDLVIAHTEAQLYINVNFSFIAV